jgi:hypothetical protein
MKVEPIEPVETTVPIVVPATTHTPWAVSTESPPFVSDNYAQQDAVV